MSVSAMQACARRWSGRLVVMVACLLSMGAQASTAWPQGQTIKIVVPFAPGGSNDFIARLIATHLGTRLQTAVVVENRGGAGGTIGTEHVVRSTADGLTLLFASTSITTNIASSKSVRYDLLKDLQPVGTIATSPFAVVVAPVVPARTLSEFLEMARSAPSRINYGSAGIGGINHLGTELLAHQAGVKLTHVPYKGIGPAFTDLLGGQLQMLLPSVASSVQYIQDGRMRGLAVTSKRRSPLLPDVPTVDEAGLPGFELEVWFGLLGPTGMPTHVVQRLNTELNAVLNEQDVQQQFAQQGAYVLPGKPEALHQLVGAEITRWTDLIRTAGIDVQ